ncbi:MAG: hypothetical protein NUV98_05860 [Candidatus Roizmanbacteria bacterium]|nr:hypothetical protein [Candidatus Roizmanbacteria bacterium]
MDESYKKILHLDFDGVCVDAPIPMKTFIGLLTKSFNTDYEQDTTPTIEESGQYSGNTLLAALEFVRHAGRSTKYWLPYTVSRLNQCFDEIHVVSGRTPQLRSLTYNQLTDAGVVVFNSDMPPEGAIYQSTQPVWGAVLQPYVHGIHLNTTRLSSSKFKAAMVQERVSEGYMVDCVEDDLKAALAMAHIHPDLVHVHLINNRSNDPWLLRRNTIDLPPNITRADSLHEVTKYVVYQHQE